jgi:uncharacterized membrane protein affecting hemolysin expression
MSKLTITIILTLVILLVTIPIISVLIASNQEQRHEQLFTTQR